MEAQPITPPFFSKPLNNDEAFEAISAINILIVPTDGTSVDCYNECLLYLRTNLTHISFQELRATQPDYEPDLQERQHERYMLFVTLADTINVAAEIDSDYVTAHSVSRNILFPDVTSTAYVLGKSPKYSYIKEQAKMKIRYVEGRNPYPLDPKLFQQASIAAAIVIHDVEVDSSDTLQQLYKEECIKRSETCGIKVVHMLCRSSKGFLIFDLGTLCSKYPWLKYNKRLNQVRVDTGVEGFSNHTISYATDYDTIALYNSSSKIIYFLRELTIHCIACIVRHFVGILETERLPESNLLCRYDDPKLLDNLSHKKRQNLVLARSYKIHGDLLMMLNNLPKAATYYVQAKAKCKVVGDILFKGAAGFCLATVLVHIAKEENAWEGARRKSYGEHDGQRVNQMRMNMHIRNIGSGTAVTRKDDHVSDTNPLYRSGTTSLSQAKRWFNFLRLNVKKHDSKLSCHSQSFYNDYSDEEGATEDNFSHIQDKQAACEMPSRKIFDTWLQGHKKYPSFDHALHLCKEAERVVRTFTKAFLMWLQVGKLPSYEFELCLIMMLHYMRENRYHQRLHFIVSRMFDYAERRLSSEDQTSFLGYLLDFTGHTPYIRKWSHYKYIYDSKRLVNKIVPSSNMIDEIIDKFMLRPKWTPKTTSELNHVLMNGTGDHETDVKSAKVRSDQNEDVSSSGAESDDADVSAITGVMEENSIEGITLELPLNRPSGDTICHPAKESKNLTGNPGQVTYSLTPEIQNILYSIINVIDSSFFAGNSVHSNRKIGWRVTKFFDIQHAYVDLAIMQCECRQMYHLIAQLAFINMMMAMEHVLMHQATTERHIEKLKRYIEKFKDARPYVGNKELNLLPQLNHLVLWQDKKHKLAIIADDRKRLFGKSTENHGVFRATATSRGLIHHCGGYTKSNHAVPLVVALDYIESKTADRDMLNVKHQPGKYNFQRKESVPPDGVYAFKVTGAHYYRGNIICKFLGSTLKEFGTSKQIQTSPRYPKATSTGEGDCGESDASPLKGEEVKESPVKVRLRSVVISRAYSSRATCKIVKMNSRHVQRVDEKDARKPTTDKVQGVPQKTRNDDIDIDLNSLQTVVVCFNNPLPVKLLVEDLTLLTMGAEVDVVRVHVPMKPLAKEVEAIIRFIPRQLGPLEIIGVRFTLFHTVRCNQLFLKIPAASGSSIMKEIFLKRHGLDENLFRVISDGGSLRFKVNMPVYRPMLSYYAVQLACKKGENGCSCHSESISRQTSLQPKMSHHYCRLQSSAGSLISSVTIGNTNECLHQVPMSPQTVASKPQEIMLCPYITCWVCRAIRQNSRELTPADSPKIELIEGEERLIVLRVHNDSKDLILKDLKISVLPVIDEPEHINTTMTRIDRELIMHKQRKSILRKETKLVKGFTMLAKMATYCKSGWQQLDGSSIPIPDLSEETVPALLPVNELNSMDDLVVSPGATLYVPIIYRASSCESQYYFCLDYVYASHQGKVSASILEPISLKVVRGLSIGKLGIQVNPNIHFSPQELVDNLNMPYQPSTLEALQEFKHIFDGELVDVVVNVVNKASNTFMCSSRGLVTFAALPGSDTLWNIVSKRLNYMDAKYMHPSKFLKTVNRHMALQWADGDLHLGELYIGDLSHDTPHDKPSSSDSTMLFSKEEYKQQIMSQHMRYTIWRAYVTKHPISILKASRVPTAIHENLHHLVESKISLELFISARNPSDEHLIYRDQEGYYITVPVGIPCRLSVLLRNNSDLPIHNYKTIIIPFLYGTYGDVKGLNYTGSLEQLGREPLLPSTSCGAYTGSSIIRRRFYRSMEVNPSIRENIFETHSEVARVWIEANESLIYGIAAAIIIKRDGVVYWHYRPLVVQVVSN